MSIDLIKKVNYMLISQKCQYALRAIFELAKNKGKEPIKIAEIAKVQAIPSRFLEVILSQLKQAGFVDSVRGNEGGYLFLRSPESLTVGEIIRFVQGPIGPIDCIADKEKKSKCPLYGGCVFLSMWEKVGKAIEEVYDNTTIQDLLDQELQQKEKYMPSYVI